MLSICPHIILNLVAAEILLQLLVVAQLNDSNEKLEKLIGNYEFNDACKEIINNYIEE